MKARFIHQLVWIISPPLATLPRGPIHPARKLRQCCSILCPDNGMSYFCTRKRTRFLSRDAAEGGTVPGPTGGGTVPCRRNASAEGWRILSEGDCPRSRKCAIPGDGAFSPKGTVPHQKLRHLRWRNSRCGTVPPPLDDNLVRGAFSRPLGRIFTAVLKAVFPVGQRAIGALSDRPFSHGIIIVK